jgi:beta-glucosidase-like glycosyl hydrolase
MKHLDPQQSIETRIAALLEMMTLNEKVHQLTGVMAFDLIRPDGSDLATTSTTLRNPPGHVAQLIRDDPGLLAADILGIQRRFVEHTRLGIPALFHAEALNGILGGGHMVFPTPIALAASWKPELVEAMAAIMRDQLIEVGIRHVLSPVMDVALDPRWGRVHETFGEDPYLVAANSVAYVRGMQTDDLRSGVIATGKHFLGYAAPESGLNAATVAAGPRRIRDVFAFPFEAAIRQTQLGSVMNTYSDIDGVPMAASRELLTGLLREELGFTGFVSADYASIQHLHARQGAARDLAEAGRLAVEAGVDVEFPRPAAFGDVLVGEVEGGRLDPAIIDLAAERVLAAKFSVGLFEKPYPRESIDITRFAREGDDLSRQLARRSVVVLENDGVLPLDPRGMRISVVGPHADRADLQFATYTYPSWRQAVDAIHLGGENTMVGVDAEADAWHQALLIPGEAEGLATERYGTASLADALARAGADVTAVAGSGLTARLGQRSLREVKLAARNADLVVVALGGGSLWFSGERTEGEASDTADISLPVAQREVLEVVASSGTPFVIVMVQGRPYPLPPVASRASALLVSSFGGPHGATAVVDVMEGAFDPIGRLPYSIPQHVGQLPLYHHRLTGSGGRFAEPGEPAPTYLDMPTGPTYPFGYGRGYTEFQVVDLDAPTTVSSRGALSVTSTVRNVGDRQGSTLVQLYARVRTAGVVRPFQQLIGFHEVFLASGQEESVVFEVDSSQFAHTGIDHQLVVDPGTVELIAGLHSADDSIRQKVELTGARRVVDRAERVYFSKSWVGVETR